ncbi:hypothetical protein C8Q76DRAFT_797448 [Earliella scabrosa]|nr:hypothetical protein C8Q76DRAFT_797448 [Earliella scabrosa]
MDNSTSAPTPQLIELACEFVSQIHHSLPKRPPADDPARQGWDIHFTHCCKSLAKTLTQAAFEELPPIAIGTIWEFNQHCYRKTAVVDADAIVPAEDEKHPAFDPFNERRLRYRPSNAGVVRVLPLERMRNTWWERREASGPSHAHGDDSVISAGPAEDLTGHDPASAEPQSDEAEIEQAELEEAEIEEAQLEEAQLEEAQLDEAEIDELDEDAGPSEPSRGRKRARSSPSGSSQSDGHAPSRRRRSASPGSAIPADIFDPTLYLAREAPPPVVNILFPFQAPSYGCDSCRKARAPCEVNVITGQTCSRCKKSKIRCSFRQVSSKTLRTYLMWRIWKLGERGVPSAQFWPAAFKTVDAAPPEWWLDIVPEEQGTSTIRKRDVSRGRRATSAVRSSSRRPSKAPTATRAERRQPSRARTRSRSVEALRPAPPKGAMTSARSTSLPSSEAHAEQSQAPVGRTTRSRKGKERAHPEQLLPLPSESTASPMLAALQIASRSATPPPTTAAGSPVTEAPAASLELVSDTAPVQHVRRTLRNISRSRPQLLLHADGLTRSAQPTDAESPTRPPPDGSDGGARQVLRVPRIDDTWRNLPELDAPAAFQAPEELDGGAPGSYTMPRNWRALARAAARPEPMANAATWSRDAPPPPGTAFVVGPATARTLEHLQDQLRRLRHLRPSMDAARAEAEALSRHIHNARLAASIRIAEAEDLDSAFRILLAEHQELASHSRQCAQLLAEVTTFFSALACAFEQIPAVPVDARSLVELQDLVHQLRGLYGETWERFDALREDIRPVREELHRLRLDYVQAIEMVEQVPNAAAQSVHSIVDALYTRVSEGIDRVGDAIGNSIGRIADALDNTTMNSEDRVRLVEELWKPMTAAVSEAGRIRGTFPRPRSPPSGLPDVLARVERLEAHTVPASPPIDIAVSDLLRRVERLEVVRERSASAEPASTPSNAGDIGVMVTELRARVEALEQQLDTTADERGRAAVRDFLAEYGLGPDELTRLGRSSIARGNQFAFPGHAFGLQGPE